MWITKRGVFKKPLIFFLWFSFVLCLSFTPQSKSSVISPGKCIYIPLKSLNFNNLSFWFPGIRLLNTSVNIDIIEDDKCTKAIKVTKINIGDLKLKLLRKWLTIKNVNISGNISFKQDTKFSSLFSISIQRFGNVKIKSSGSTNDYIYIQIISENLDIFPIVKQLLPAKLADGKLNLSMNTKVVFNVSTRESTLLSNIKIRNGSWEDEDFEYAGEKVNMNLTISGRTKKNNSFFWGKGKAIINVGNVIFKDLFLNFTKTPLTIKFFTKINKGRNKVVFDPLSVNLKNTIKCLVRGPLIENMSFELQTKNPGGIMQLLMPDMAKKAKAEGFLQIKGSLGLRNGNKLFFLGRTMGDINLKLSNSSKMHLLADLPFNLSTLEDEQPQKAKQRAVPGYIKIEDLQFDDLYVQKTTFHLLAIKNGWLLEKKVNVRSNKGTVSIIGGKLKIFPKLSGLLKISTPECFKYSINKDFLSFPLQMKVCLPRYEIKLNGNNLISKGSLKLHLLSGELIISNLRIEKVFSNERSIIMNANWKDIDLQQLSSITSFGLITGKLKGSIKNLRIAYGVPVAFDLTIESQPAKNQTISIAAIENITQVGSATSPFQTLAGKIITTFFKRFPYAKIGIRCVLKNDFFSLQGLIKEGNTEYLIKRRGLKGVNVINRRSPNLISWREMIKRLKRIKRVETTTTGEGTNGQIK